jgi:hypothetical protein
VRGRATTTSLFTPRSPRAGPHAFALALEGARSAPTPPDRPLWARTPTELRAAGCVLESAVASEAGGSTAGGNDAAQAWLDGLDGHSQLVPVLTALRRPPFI